VRPLTDPALGRAPAEPFLSDAHKNHQEARDHRSDGSHSQSRGQRHAAILPGSRRDHVRPSAELARGFSGEGLQ